jgi:hypothetical protein
MEVNLAFIPVQIDTLAMLLSLRSSNADSIDKIVESLVKNSPVCPVDPKLIQSIPEKAVRSGKYQFTLLDEPLGADNLPQVLTSVLGILSDYDENLLPKLSKRSGRTRRYVAERAELIHIGRPDFAAKTVEFRPGWWVGINYGKKEVKSILEAACSLCGIKYRADLVLQNF